MGIQQLCSPKLSPALFLLTLLLLPSPPKAAATLGIQQWRIMFSLSHSLMLRVANARASRGDLSGAERARKIAWKLEGGVGLSGVFWSMGWDYMKNYAWRDITSVWPPRDMFRAVSDMNELLGALKEVNRLESPRERANWVLQNYQRVLSISKSILGSFLSIFSRSGPLREMVFILQKEAEGDLLRDCIELGANDLKGLLQVAKDIASNYMPSSSPGHKSDDL